MARVYFLDLRKKHKDNVLILLKKLTEKIPYFDSLKNNSLCAVKVHVGEQGNVNYVSPDYVRCIFAAIEKKGFQAFLTDTTTLYSGQRRRADLHMKLAYEHGFNFAPFIVGDGLYGDDFVEVNGSKIASLFTHIENMVCISHFKGHMNCGFGGAIKNLGMGCAAKGGKLEMHSKSKPRIDKEKCTQCYRCVEYCIYRAIEQVDKIPNINEEKCVGCCGCMSVCPERAIGFSWDAASSDVQQGIARYASNAIKGKAIIYFNFLINITPNCDCFHSNEPVIMPDIGILVSSDPVSIDQACYDMIKERLEEVYPNIDSQIQLVYAEKFGAGERVYEIKEV
jgi:uncharacterized Fe-S center protein